MAEATYTNSAHQSVIGIVKITKDCHSSSAPVAQIVKCVPYSGSNLPFAELFFSLFKFQITSEKHFFSVKMKEITKKVENKVSGRVRVGVGRALLSQ